MADDGADRRVLKYCGFLGHTVVVVRDAKAGGRHAGLECSDLGQARTYAASAVTANPIVYRRAGKTWKRTA